MSDRALWQEFCKMEADRDRLRALLTRLSQWDQMNPPMSGDHAHWKREIDAALAGAAVPASAPPACDVCGGGGWITFSAEPTGVARCDACNPAVPASGGHTMDEGPWTVIRDKVSGYGIGVGSDDFKRDVLLRVDGDFGCGVEKTDYCAWLARTLNQIGGRSHCPHCGQWHNMDAGC